MFRRRLLQVFAVVAGCIVLREAGVWSVRLVRTQSTFSTLSLKLDFADGRPYVWPEKPPEVGFTNATDENAGDVILEEFRRQLDATPLADGHVVALRIDRVRTTGCRWLPMYKPIGGRVEASLVVERTRDGVPLARNRSAKIDVDLSVVGICSARDATDEFAKVVSGALVHSAAEP